jgi:integrase-like protein
MLSFNSRIRDECLNLNSFWSLAQAHVVISDWKQDYSHHRRHSVLVINHQRSTLLAAVTSDKRPAKLTAPTRIGSLRNPVVLPEVGRKDSTRADSP